LNQRRIERVHPVKANYIEQPPSFALVLERHLTNGKAHAFHALGLEKLLDNFGDYFGDDTQCLAATPHTDL
jgi:hypothetical protein